MFDIELDGLEGVFWAFQRFDINFMGLTNFEIYRTRQSQFVFLAKEGRRKLH